jgi:hypothetical protein
MKSSAKLIVLLVATLCIGEIAVSVRLGSQSEENSLQFNSMGEIKGEGEVQIPKIPEGSALQRCRFKCDNLAFLPKDMAGNVSSEHCYLGCLWFSELGCTPLPPAIPHINQPLLDQPPPPAPKAVTGGTGTTGGTGSTGASGATGSSQEAGAKAQLLKTTEKLLKKTKLETKKAQNKLMNSKTGATGATGATGM